jgi:hypothetical protein
MSWVVAAPSLHLRWVGHLFTTLIFKFFNEVEQALVIWKVRCSWVIRYQKLIQMVRSLHWNIFFMAVYFLICVT